MRVGRADQDCFFRYPAAAVDFAPHLFDDLTANEQRIEADHRHPLAAVIPNGGSDLARIMQRAMKGLAVSARLFHADFWRDVSFGKSDLQRDWLGGGLSRQNEASQTCDEKQSCNFNESEHGDTYR